jgi:hypothetical protein
MYNVFSIQVCHLQIGLEVWAWENPTIWENTRGISVYSFNEAWGKSEYETLIHNDIIIHLRKALDNLINKDKYFKIVCVHFIHHFPPQQHG